MKKSKTYVSLSLLLALLTATACGTDKPAATPGNATANTVSSTNDTANATNDTANSNSSTTGNASSISLTPFQQAEASGIHVTTPAGWNEEPLHGGDYIGWQLTNPNDSNQQVKIITSSCVGCTTAPDGSVQAKLVIPEKNAQITKTSDNQYIANFTFPTSTNSNTGTGVVAVSHDSSGYGSIEIVLPASEQALAQQIIDSFQLSR
jgi:hypothetical protein